MKKARLVAGMGRMIFELPDAVQMAIKLRAVKDRKTTGEVVSEAIRQVFPEDVREAEQVLEKPAPAKEGPQ